MLEKQQVLTPSQNLVPLILFRPVFLVVSNSTAEKIRIMLLKAMHAPLLIIIWLYERWETFKLKRAARALGSSVFGITSAGMISAPQPDSDKPKKRKTTTTALSKKHPLKKPGAVHVPTALLASASQRPAKETGAPIQQGAAARRLSTAPAAVVAVDPAHVGAPQSAQSVDAAGAAEMMRMLKELSAQVEEVRAALVKHDQGPGE